MNLSLADKALREAHGEKGLSIKGASSRGNVVQVGGLAKGTTSEDVEVCSFSSYRLLMNSYIFSPRFRDDVGHLQTMRSYYGIKVDEEYR